MGSKEQRVLIALISGPALARADDFKIVRKAEVVLLDFGGIAKQQRRKTPGERGLAHALGTRKQQGLRDALLRRHTFERARDLRMAPEILKHKPQSPPTLSQLRIPASRGRQ